MMICKSHGLSHPPCVSLNFFSSDYNSCLGHVVIVTGLIMTHVLLRQYLIVIVFDGLSSSMVLLNIIVIGFVGHVCICSSGGLGYVL
jgi:hypothetical protein